MKKIINRPMAESDERAFCWLIENPISEEGFLSGFIPGVESVIKARGEMRLLVHFKDYKGWDKSAIPADIEFMSRFYPLEGRTALVNSPEKLRLRINAMKDFIGSEVRFFDEDALADALVWVKE